VILEEAGEAAGVSFMVPGRLCYRTMGVTWVDLDGDGDLDLLQAGRWVRSESPFDIFSPEAKPSKDEADAAPFLPLVLRNDGPGPRGVPRFADISRRSDLKLHRPGEPCSKIAVGDVNDDGVTDLVVSCGGGSDGHGGLAVLLGQGQGVFGSPRFVPFHVPVTSVKTADLNRDGRPDMVAGCLPTVGATDQRAGSVVVADFAAGLDATSVFSVGGGVGDLAVADWNGDGDLDVVAAVPSLQQLVLLSGDGQGSLSADSFLYVYGLPAAVAAADLDRDGVMDLVTVRQRYDVAVVFFGLGGGSFSDPVYDLVGGRPSDIVVFSFNGDIMPDLAVVNAGDGTVTTLVTMGQGSFGMGGVLDMEPGIIRAAAAYLDTDDQGDLAVASSATDQIWSAVGKGDGSFVVRAKTATCDSPVSVLPTDLNGDGVVDLVTACSFGDAVGVHMGHVASSGEGNH